MYIGVEHSIINSESKLWASWRGDRLRGLAYHSIITPEVRAGDIHNLNKPINIHPKQKDTHCLQVRWNYNCRSCEQLSRNHRVQSFTTELGLQDNQVFSMAHCGVLFFHSLWRRAMVVLVGIRWPYQPPQVIRSYRNLLTDEQAVGSYIHVTLLADIRAFGGGGHSWEWHDFQSWLSFNHW